MFLSNDTNEYSVLFPYGDVNATMPPNFNTYFENSLEYHVLIQLKNYVQPIFLVLGTVSNLTALVVLLRRHASQNSMYWYMAALTVVNTLILYAGCGVEWFCYILEARPPIMLADWICRVWHVIFNIIRYSSSWLVVAMVTDRFLVMWFPRHGQMMSSVFMAKVMTTFIFIALLVVYVHYMWSYELSSNGCGRDPDQKDFETTIWPFVAATISSYLPSLGLIFLMLVLAVGRCILPNGTETGTHGNESLTCFTIFLALWFLMCSLPTIVLNFIQFSTPTWFISNDLRFFQLRSRFYLAQGVCGLVECFYTSSSCLLYFLFLPSMRCSIETMCCGTVCGCRGRRNRAGSHELQSLAEVKGSLLVKTDGVCVEGATCL